MKDLRVVVAAVLITAALTCPAQRGRPKRQMAHLPPPVQKAIRAKLGDGKLNSVDKDTDDGDVEYDVEMTREGVTRSFTVDDEGELLDEQVFLNELPPKVQETIKKHIGAETLGDIDRSFEDSDEGSYDVEMTAGGITRNFTVDNDGALAGEQVLLRELPRAVQLTILKETGNALPSEIDKTYEDDETNYNVEFTHNGSTRNFTVSMEGTLTGEELDLADLPAALQAAIKKQLAGAEPDEIQRTFDDGEIRYEVDAGTDSADRTFSFDSTGQLRTTEEEIPAAEAPAPVQSQIKALSADRKLLGVTRVTDDNEVTYDVDMEKDGSETTTSLDASGNTVEDN